MHFIHYTGRSTNNCLLWYTPQPYGECLKIGDDYKVPSQKIMGTGEWNSARCLFCCYGRLVNAAVFQKMPLLSLIHTDRTNTIVGWISLKTQLAVINFGKAFLGEVSFHFLEFNWNLFKRFVSGSKTKKGLSIRTISVKLL